jgi:hypothetical protein
MSNKDFQNGFALGRVSGGGMSTQPDWAQNDPAAADYIKNKPFYDDGENIHKLDDKYLNLATDEDIMDTMTEMGLVTPVMLEGAILISNDNEIYSL